jgi:uncharacterized membrane protein
MKHKPKNNSALDKKRNSKNIFLVIILILTLNGLLFSLLIEYQNFKESKILDNICTATGSGCNSVQNSEYGKILGVKVAHMGVAAFALFLIIVVFQLLRPNKWTKIGLLIGAILAAGMGIYFIYTQAFKLHHYCIYCLIIDSSSILILITTLFYFYKYNSVAEFQKAL